MNYEDNITVNEDVYKVDNYRAAKLLFNNENLLLKLGKSSLYFNEGDTVDIACYLNKNKDLVDNLDSMVSSVKDYIYKNSEKLFKGKKFSKSRIESSFEPFYTVQKDEDGEDYVRLNNIQLCEDTKYIDMFSKHIEKPIDNIKECRLVLLVDIIKFLNNKISLQVKVKRVKVYYQHSNYSKLNMSKDKKYVIYTKPHCEEDENLFDSD